MIRLNAREHINEILRIKRDGGSFAFNLRLYVRRMVSYICCGGDVDCTAALCCNREPNNVGGGVSHDLCKLYGAKEVVTNNDRLGGVCCWDHLLERWELPVNQAAHEHCVAELELQLILCWRQGDLHQLINVGEDAEEFGVSTRRNNDACLWCRLGKRRAGYRNAVVVRGGKRRLLSSERCKDAGENWASLVASGGEDGGIKCGA